MESQLPNLGPCETVYQEQTLIFKKFEAFLEFLCNVDRSEYKSFADKTVFDRLVANKDYVERCFSKNLKTVDFDGGFEDNFDSWDDDENDEIVQNPEKKVKKTDGI